VVQELVGVGPKQLYDIGFPGCFPCGSDGCDGWHDAVLLNTVDDVISPVLCSSAVLALRVPYNGLRDRFGLTDNAASMIYSLGERKVITRGDYWVADSATVIGSVVLEHNVSIWFNTVVRGDNDLITIGEGSNVQDSSVLHTDAGVRLTIEKNVTIGHQVMLHGCTIGEGTLIGIKSTVLNHARIGKHCLIGAHALITEGKEIPDRSLVIGSPGKVVRQLTDEEVEGLLENALHYVTNFQRFRLDLRVQQG
jgi:carbonic anhydrase/acetyltransferase-like protein (isoleucine patch superfamily)